MLVNLWFQNWWARLTWTMYNMINKIPQISDLEIPVNLKHAKRSELWDWWKQACMEELNSLNEFDVWDVLEENGRLRDELGLMLNGGMVFDYLKFTLQSKLWRRQRNTASDLSFQLNQHCRINI
ncbi:uncharacterized protein VP01_827g2 [Puccinia sorghi]|uniref:Uncharacterized protein n=1 Tax=Puccinia sorghi TaxID=27349 RepID=A0A0L6UBW2_9BASI|nr:uncharacterized protein VP01_827g2 [Puccinia sorghi]